MDSSNLVFTLSGFGLGALGFVFGLSALAQIGKLEKRISELEQRLK
ncbi:MAG: hypothetical protein ACOX4Q_07305 [Syntrophomonadales bacterium]